MKKLFLALGAAACMLFAGCATTGGDSAADRSETGFLSDYAKLQPVGDKKGLRGYVAPGMDMRAYTKVYFDPVQIFLSNDPQAYRGIQPDVLKRIADAFRAAFINAASAGYRVVDQPGPDVLRVRMAITGLQPVATPIAVYDLLPIKAVFNAGRAAAGASPRLAEVSTEIEVLDPQGRPVGALVATRESEETMAHNDNITWEDVSRIVDSLSKMFWVGMEQLRGKQPTK